MDKHMPDPARPAPAPRQLSEEERPRLDQRQVEALRKLHIALVLASMTGCVAPPAVHLQAGPGRHDFADLGTDGESSAQPGGGLGVSTEIKEVDGVAINAPLSALSERIPLRPGAHLVGIHMAGHGKDARAGLESYVCMKITANWRTHYVLRGGFADPAHFRLNLIGIDEQNIQSIATVTVPVALKRTEPICAPFPPPTSPGKQAV